MNIKHCAWTKLVLAALVLTTLSACGHRRKAELNELRRVAFTEATKRYVLTDTVIESQYNQKTAVPCPVKPTVTRESSPRPIQGKPLFDFSEFETSEKGTNESLTDYESRLRCEARRKKFRVPAVELVRGVQLSPSNQANIYIVKFDFEPSNNPNAEIPENKVTAEKFERPDGTHYWVLSW